MIATRSALPPTVTFTRVTPALASLWLETRQYTGQRTLRPAHVKYLAEEMRRGRFQETAQIVFCVLGDKYFNVNGNHTMNAIVASQMPQTLIVVEVPVEDMEEVAEIYGAIDTNLGRTVADYFTTINLKGEVNLTATQLNSVGGACKFIYNHFRTVTGSRMHPDEYTLMIRKFAPYARQYFDLQRDLSHAISQPARRSATMSVALITFAFSAQRYSLELVEDFWIGALFNDGLTKGDPRKLAHQHLMTVAMSAGSGAATRKAKKASPHYSARWIANCFNAFLEGRSITTTKIPDANAPIKILGSSWTGKE